MSETLSRAASGAAAGMVLGPVGAAVGGLLGAAPGLLEAFGVHLGNETTAGKIMAIVQAVTGKQDPSGADMTGLSSDQRVALQIALAQIDAAAEKAERDAELAALMAQIGDVASARARDAAITGAGRSNTRANVMLASAAVIAAGCYALIGIWGRSMDTAQVGALCSAGGIALGCLKDAFGFEFGSSAGSRDKDATIRAAVGG